jgi:AcrR family transcriptional regulator
MTQIPTTESVDSDASRRSRKKSKTHADLMEAGAALFAADGFDETTTSDIAERADVSQRTLFRHFPTKEALLYGDMEELRLELRESLAARPVDEPLLASIRGAMLSLADNFARNRDRRLLQAKLAARYPAVSAYSRAIVQAEWEREIIAAAAAKLGVDPMVDPRPEVLAGATMSAIRIATRQWTASRGKGDYVQMVVAALDSIGNLGALDTPS